MQPGIRQLHLGLDAGDLGDSEGCCRTLAYIAQQRCLADPRYTADDQRRAAAGLGFLEEAVEYSSLADPTAQLRTGLARRSKEATAGVRMSSRSARRLDERT